MTLDDTWDRFVKKYTGFGEVIVGRTVSMKEFAKVITLASLEEIFALRMYIDGEKIDTERTTKRSRSSS